MGFKQRVFSLMVIDFVLLFVALLGAYLLRFEGQIPAQYLEGFKLLVLPMAIINLAFLYGAHLYRKIWQYASIGELTSILKAMTLASLVAGVANQTLQLAAVPYSIYLIAWVLKIGFIGGSRLAWRVYRDSCIKKQPHHKRALIVGAGAAGGLVAKEILNNQESDIYPVGFVDDDQTKQHLEIYGFPVLGDSFDIHRIVKKHQVDEIIIAIPSASREEQRRVFDICKEVGVKLRTLPPVYDLIAGKVKVNKLRDVSVEDLLGREPVQVDLNEIAQYIKGETVLVTGAGGSIGSELSRQAASFTPKKLILLGHGENSIYDIELELRDRYPKLHIQTEICDVKDKTKVDYIFAENKPDVVFHAAAHKHVPLMERNPEEAVKNNVLGTKNLAEAADKYSSKTFVFISTDKAVNPTNVMGATKRIAEMIIQSMDKKSNTRYVAVRFGNVLGSRGSVIPIFKRQIARGGPVTVTHPEMVRFFMTIPEAVQLVIQAGSMADGGEIFVLDMGEPVKISQLAKDLIHLSGFEPNRDIEIKYTGIRPGEKLYEELLTSEEGTSSTKHQRIFVARPNGIDETTLEEFATEAKSNNLNNNPMAIIDYLQRLIPTFKPQNEAFKKREVG
ncbi:FlaA1/EpsC-like NDP-sugar epimerase [Desulfitispora alkaliphila]|uniref:polysaccharide biosynthesis protein n=1 Tax=Desulfitispora alkaliphila TaxID=622674 RepID=UPI003D1CBB02